MNRAFGFCACMTACSLAFAQHADDNAVRAAVDAFGSTIGSETVGLYGPDYVRGFNPQSAGNLRIEGMYFDQQGALSERVLDGLTVRVGPSAHQYPFPAPTGIIDYDLRRRAERNTLTPSVRIGPFDSVMAQADGHLAVPLANLYIPGGIAYGIQADIPNHTERAFSVGVAPNWRPSDRLSIRLFLDYQRFLDSRTQPRVYSDELFPPPLVSPKFFGQPWADSAIRFSTVGGTLRWHIDTHWTLMSGLFYSSNFSSPQFVDQFVNTTRLGLAQHQVIGYPDQSQASSSGEIRLRWHRQSGAWYHALIGMIRARDVLTRYAGDDLRELLRNA